MSYDVEGDCMSRWFETIIQKVTPSTNKPIIVIDSQKYLEITEVQDRLTQEDYKLIFVEPGIRVRMKYELEVRDRNKTILVITGKYPLVDDMKESAFVVELKPKEVFRNFDENAINGLNYNELCKLDDLQIFSELTFEETKKIIDEKIKTITDYDIINEINSSLNVLENTNFDILDEKQWFYISKSIGTTGERIFRIKDTNIEERFLSIINKLNTQFQQFLDAKYDSLFTRSGIKYPYTLDKIQEYIAYNSKDRKIAFIVIDGMNYWQWTLLKQSLENEKLNIQELTTLSWIPSITAWARQSIFAGKKPDLSIDNRKEGDLFKKYWIEKQNRMPYQVYYENLKTDKDISIPSPDITVVGFAINVLDEMMHGNILGYEQLYLNTKHWIDKSNICSSIKSLRNAGFDIYISTDHGNIEAELNLKLTADQKQVMHSRSKRFIQFDTEEQANSYIVKNKEYLFGKKDKSVYFKDTNGFGTNREKVITHGGSHVLELLIPVGVIK